MTLMKSLGIAAVQPIWDSSISMALRARIMVSDQYVCLFLMFGVFFCSLLLVAAAFVLNCADSSDLTIDLSDGTTLLAHRELSKIVFLSPYIILKLPLGSELSL